jgi:hypothetical protein
MIQINARDQELSGIEPRLHLNLRALQAEYKLSDLEMIEILHNFIGNRISRFIKHEHENDEAGT